MIKQLRIFGFGKWQDEQLDFDNNRFTTIFGENEAGKSTIKAFILFMLFGLPPRELKKFEPKQGGRLGGQLILVDKKWGAVKIERLYNGKKVTTTCYLEDGTIKDENFVLELFRGIDCSTYESIFSFGSRQLQDIHKLNANELGNALLGVGMTGSQKIHELEKKLAKSTSELFKYSGKKPDINKQLAKIKELEQQIRNAEQNEGVYQELLTERKKVIEQIEQERQILQTYQEEINTLERKLQIINVVHEYQQLNQQFSDQEQLHVPETALQRYNQLKEAILPLKSEQELLNEALSQSESHLHSLLEGAFASQDMVKLNQLIEEGQSLIYLEERIEQETDQYNRETNKVQFILQDLDLQLSIEDVKSLRLPAFTREKWQKLSQERETINHIEGNHRETEAALTKQFTTIENQLGKFENASCSNETYQEYKKRLANEQEMKMKEELLQEQEKIQEQMRAKQKQQLNYRKRVVNFTFTIMSIISVMVMAVGFVYEFSWILILGLFALISCGVLYKVVHNFSQKLSDMTNTTQLTERIDQQKPTLSRKEKEQLEAYVQSYEENLQQIQQIKRKKNELELEHVKNAEHMNSLASRVEKFDQNIEEQQSGYPFLRYVDVEFWPEVFDRLKRIQEKIDDLNVYHQSIRKQEQQLCVFTESAQVFLTKYESAITEPASGKKVFEALTQLNNKVTNNHQLIEQEKKRSIECKEKRRQIEKQIDPYLKEMKQLREGIGASDELLFYRKAELSQQIDEMKREKRRLKQQVYSLFPDDCESVLHEVLSEFEINTKLKNLKERYHIIEEELESHRQRKADLTSKIDQLEGSDELSNLYHAFAREKAKLKELSVEWATFEIANQLIKKTKEIFQTERLPNVFKNTAHYFSILTHGNYVNVIPPINSSSIKVEDRNSNQFFTEELSDGTADQLYVALRIALSEDMSDEHALPFIIDDGFVHFDHKRTEAMFKILNEISAKHQILLFSCQSHILNMAPNNGRVFIKQNMRSLKT